MKAKLKAKIIEVGRNVKFEGTNNTDIVGLTKIKLVSTTGKVETALNNAQLVALSGDLFLKDIIANSIKIGAVITITISDEETVEE